MRLRSALRAGLLATVLAAPLALWQVTGGGAAPGPSLNVTPPHAQAGQTVAATYDWGLSGQCPPGATHQYTLEGVGALGAAVQGCRSAPGGDPITIPPNTAPGGYTLGAAVTSFTPLPQSSASIPFTVDPPPPATSTPIVPLFHPPAASSSTASVRATPTSPPTPAPTPTALPTFPTDTPCSDPNAVGTCPTSSPSATPSPVAAAAANASSSGGSTGTTLLVIFVILALIALAAGAGYLALRRREIPSRIPPGGDFLLMTESVSPYRPGGVPPPPSARDLPPAPSPHDIPPAPTSGPGAQPQGPPPPSSPGSGPPPPPPPPPAYPPPPQGPSPLPPGGPPGSPP